MESIKFSPPTIIRKVWLATYGGHYDIVVMAFVHPNNKKPRYGLSGLDMPSGSLSVELGSFLEFFDITEEKMIELGLLNPQNNNRPFDAVVNKWIKVEIELPGREEYGPTWLNMNEEGYFA